MKAGSTTKKPQVMLTRMPEDQRMKILDTVLARYVDGGHISDMAKEFGVNDVSVYAALLQDKPQEWRSAMAARSSSNYAHSLALKDLCRAELDTAKDSLSIQKARERLRYAESVEKRSQWELERLIPLLFGQEKSPAQAPVAIQINLRRDLS